MSNEVEKATATATSEDFRPLPTPEQVRAHGDGGLWESNGGVLYRFFDRPRNEAWWDVGGVNGAGFSRSGRPWSFGKGDPRDLAFRLRPMAASGVRGADSFRPLNTIGKPRPWSEIDAITGATTPPASTLATPVTPAPLAIVPPPGGKFQVGDVVTLHRFSNDEKFAGGNPHWAEPMTHLVGRTVTIDSVPDYVPGRVRACGWTWPVERVSFVSRPGVTTATPTVATATATVPNPEPEFRVPTDDEIRAHEANGGMWQVEKVEKPAPRPFRLMGLDKDGVWGWFVDSWEERRSGWILADRESEIRQQTLRPVDKKGVPMSWPKPVQAATATPDDTAFRPGCPSVAHVEAAQRLGLMWQSGKPLSFYSMEVVDGEVCVGLTRRRYQLWATDPETQSWRPAKTNSTVVAWSVLDAEVKRLEQQTHNAKLAQPIRVASSDGTSSRSLVDASMSKLPSDGDPMSVAGAIAVAREGAQQAIAASLPLRVDTSGALRTHATTLGDEALRQVSEVVQNALNASPWKGLDTLAGIALTNYADVMYAVRRQPEETDQQLRQRCRDKWTQKETATMPVLTMSTMPNFTNMTPEQRAEYRKALDAAEPPTFKSALMSGLEHAPIEGALDRAHKLLDEAVTTFWVAGSDDDKATVRRFFRDLLTSEYGKAGMAFGAGALLPYAADAAESLLPGDNAAPRYINRAAWLFTERGATITARELGGAAIDAIGPLLGTLRRLLVDLVAGMRVAEKGVAGLLTATPVRGGDLFGGGVGGVVGGDVETTQAKQAVRIERQVL